MMHERGSGYRVHVSPPAKGVLWTQGNRTSVTFHAVGDPGIMSEQHEEWITRCIQICGGAQLITVQFLTSLLSSRAMLIGKR
jgi:hypothetical protein